MLLTARLRHIAGTRWGLQKYINMDCLTEQHKEATDHVVKHSHEKPVIRRLEKLLAA